MFVDVGFTKENLDACLNRLAKEYRKINGRGIHAEIILVGGAAVLVNYGFRDRTYDIDAIISATSAMKEAINIIGDEMGFPNGWFNSDFVKTKSYSTKLLQYSVFYKQFGHILDVRTVSSEYLVAMKLMSGRKYKNDISDIVGILSEHKKCGKVITLEMIEKAVCNLYGSWDSIPEESVKFIEEVIQEEKYENMYAQYREKEKMTKESLVDFEKKYPGVTTTDNVDDIIKKLQLKNK